MMMERGGTRPAGCLWVDINITTVDNMIHEVVVVVVVVLVLLMVRVYECVCTWPVRLTVRLLW